MPQPALRPPGRRGASARARGRRRGVGRDVGAAMDAALALAAHELCGDDSDAVLAPLGEVYFRCALASSARLLLARATGPAVGVVVGLDASAALAGETPEATRLAGIVAAAESEAGQAALRDLYLSLAAPRRRLRPRRKAVIGRVEAQQLALHEPLLVAQAHTMAMRGAAETWRESECAVARAAALLAGLHVLTRHEPNDDAFAGRVALDFLVARAPVRRALRLVQSDGAWCVVRPRADGVTVAYREDGFAGLCRSVLVVAHDVAAARGDA